MRHQLCLSLLFVLILQAPNAAHADDVFVDFYNYCTYGLITGMLIGGASIALAEDPGGDLSPLAKGASLGLYAGAIVSLYKNWTPYSRTHIDLAKNFETATGTRTARPNTTELASKLEPHQTHPNFLLVPRADGAIFALSWQL